MICGTVASLVGADTSYDVPHCHIYRQLVVITDLPLGDDLSPILQNTIGTIYVFKHSSVGFNCLFLQISHKSMGECGVQQVADEEEIKENSLQSNNKASFQKSWLFDVEENKKMESFIIGLLEQMMDPSFIPLEDSQTLQVPSHTSHHAGDTCHCLQDQASLHPFGNCHGLLVVVSQKIVASSDSPDAFVSYPVFDPVWLNVLDFNLLGSSFGINIMGHSVVGIVINSLPPWQNIIKGFQILHELSIQNCIQLNIISTFPSGIFYLYRKNSIFYSFLSYFHPKRLKRLIILHIRSILPLGIIFISCTCQVYIFRLAGFQNYKDMSEFKANYFEFLLALINEAIFLIFG